MGMIQKAPMERASSAILARITIPFYGFALLIPVRVLETGSQETARTTKVSKHSAVDRSGTLVAVCCSVCDFGSCFVSPKRRVRQIQFVFQFLAGFDEVGVLDDDLSISHSDAERSY
jgi:hypothetical protein